MKKKQRKIFILKDSIKKFKQKERQKEASWSIRKKRRTKKKTECIQHSVFILADFINLI